MKRVPIVLGMLIGAAGLWGAYANTNQGASYPPIMVQATQVVTDASGNWSVTWNQAFQTSTPFIAPLPVNSTATNPYQCNVSSMTATTATGKCWQTASQNVALISLNISLAPTSIPAATAVQVIGRDRTQ